MGQIDWIILLGTLLFIVAYGTIKSRGSKNISDYLKGGNKAHWWTIGLSVMATQASAITFLSTPGQAYHDGMGFVQFYFGLPIAMVIQVIWWVRGDSALEDSGSNIASATGLGDRGDVRAFEPPHTGTNYLMKEMVHVVGRKHAMKLRLVALCLLMVLPILLLLIPFAHVFAAVAVLSHVAGVMVSRWLFFAEAEHVVGLYYGQR